MTAAQPSPSAGAPDTGGTAAPEHDLDALLAGAATGDQAAFMRVYDLTIDCVYGLALRLLGDRVAAEDVAAAAYLEVWSDSPRFDSARQSAAARIMTTTHAHVATLLCKRATQELADLCAPDGLRRWHTGPLSRGGSAQDPTTASISSWGLRVGTTPAW